jgi:hypothetical protein
MEFSEEYLLQPNTMYGWILLQALLLSCVGREVCSWTSDTISEKLRQWRATLETKKWMKPTNDMQAEWAAGDMGLM